MKLAVSKLRLNATVREDIVRDVDALTILSEKQPLALSRAYEVLE